MNIAQWIMVAANLPVVITAVYAAATYPLLTKELKVFAWFVWLSVIVHLTSLCLWWAGINNMPVLHLYVWLGFLSIAWFYRQLLQSFINPVIILVLAILFSGFTIVNSIVLQPIDTFNSYALTVESILVVILSLSAFIVMLNPLAMEQLKQGLTSLRWINAGLFIYYASNLLIFYFGKIMMNELPTLFNQYAWVLHAFFSTVMYICFITALWKRPVK